MTTQENINKVLAGLDAVNRRDLAGFMSLLEPDFKLFLILKPERLLPQGKVSGPEGFAAYLNMLYTAFTDAEFKQKSVQANGNMVHQEFVILGRHSGALVLPTGITIPPTGRKINLPIEVFHTFNDRGGFISSTGYANLLDILKQFKI
jgi:predicted ester cyclase